jgi:hypothetical protein
LEKIKKDRPMLEAMIPCDINIENVHSYIHRIESTKKEITYNVGDKDMVNRLILLSQAHNFFADLHKYHQYMQLSNEQIESFILDLDDLIDNFEDITNKTSSNQLLNDYYKKADEFYTLLVNCQVELGFYLSDRKYA